MASFDPAPIIVRELFRLTSDVRCGSKAAKDSLVKRMPAFSQKAELNQACFSVLFCSEFGQERTFPSHLVITLISKYST
jgi:hypothetical protein